VVFVDVETTGLAGGAGTYAFLIGCGWFEATAFYVRQLVLTSYGAERSLLEHLAPTLGGASALVTYNGKTFDLPLVETRFAFHRMERLLTAAPHIDMLHIARRLWPPVRVEPRDDALPGRDAEDGRATCRLTAIARDVLGHVREGDVPGVEIPSRYFAFVRSGDPRPLEAVLEHNRLDLLALAMLTVRAARLLELGSSGARTAREALGLGRLYERGGLIREARSCFARAAGVRAGVDNGANDVAPFTHVDPVTQAEALRAYAIQCRRSREYEEAADAWSRILTLRPTIPVSIAQRAAEALAVHHEHRRGDLLSARHFAVQTLQFGASAARAQAIHYRLARINRKLASPPSSPSLL
jgi:hypothetical protein